MTGGEEKLKIERGKQKSGNHLWSIIRSTLCFRQTALFVGRPGEGTGQSALTYWGTSKLGKKKKFFFSFFCPHFSAFLMPITSPLPPSHTTQEEFAQLDYLVMR